jgi:multiple sugar transport system substrate-binding protein
MTTSRRTAFAAAAVATALVVAACGGDDDADEDTGDTGADEGTSEDESSEDDEAAEAEAVTLNFTFWGNDDRADRYAQSIEIFMEENPNIDVQQNFASWPDYWPARATEAAGDSLPDVMQMDLSYLRQYTAPGQLLALDDYVGNQLDLSGFDETLLPAAQIDGSQYGVPIGTNAFAMFYNPDVLEAAGVEQPADIQTWEEYNDFIAEAAAAGATTDDDHPIYGGADYTGTFWMFMHKLRQDGKEVFTDDGQLAFTKDDLRDWWNSMADLRESEAVYPVSRAEQLAPLGGFTVAETPSEMSWDNFIAFYTSDLGDKAPEAGLTMAPIPSDDPNNLGLFLKPSMMHSVAANTEHPEESAVLVNFLVNDPRVAEIFGTSLGLPASQTQRDSITLEGMDAQVAAYEDSIAQYLSNSPPPPVEGFGTLEENFRQIGIDLNYGSYTVDEAVDLWFSDAETTLSQ